MEKFRATYDMHGCFDAIVAARKLNKERGEEVIGIHVSPNGMDDGERQLEISCLSEAVKVDFLEEKALIAEERLKRGIAV
jgi:hypothetical protein